MIKIALDVSPLSDNNNFRGVGFYTRNLISSLKLFPEISIQEFVNIDEIKDADIVHFPYFDFYKVTLPLVKKFKTIVTIHDVIPLIFPDHYPPGIKGAVSSYIQRFLLRNIDAVITDSISSKNDIIKHLGINASDINVVYLAQSSSFKKLKTNLRLNDIKNRYNLPKKFALYVGSVNWNKNILNMTEACLRSNTELVLVGKDFMSTDNLNHPELRSFKEFIDNYSNNPLVHILGYIPNKDLELIMNLATVLLLVSNYEGFGLSILEAQSCGVPVITGNVSSMPEVAGKGALLVDSYDVGNISKAISLLQKDQSVRKNLVLEGYKNVKKYSWKTTGENTLKVYNKVISSNHER